MNSTKKKVWSNYITESATTERVLVLVWVCRNDSLSLHTPHHTVARWAEAQSKYITMFICRVITLSIAVPGQGVRWVCGTSGVNKLLQFAERLTQHLSQPWGGCTWEESIPADEDTSADEKKKWWLSFWKVTKPFSSSHKKSCGLWLFIQAASLYFGIIIIGGGVIILSCNKNPSAGISQPSPQQRRHLIVIQCSQEGQLIVSFEQQKQCLTNKERCGTLRNNRFAITLLLEGGQQIVISHN